MSLKLLKEDTDIEVKINWIEQHDYDLYQYVKSVFNHKHFSRVLLSIKPRDNRVTISFVNLAHTKCMLLESKQLDHLSWSLEEGINEALESKDSKCLITS